MTVPKISDHHHLLQAPANQLSVLPKKSAEAPSRKRSRSTLSSLVSELRERARLRGVYFRVRVLKSFFCSTAPRAAVHRPIKIMSDENDDSTERRSGARVLGGGPSYSYFAGC